MAAALLPGIPIDVSGWTPRGWNPFPADLAVLLGEEANWPISALPCHPPSPPAGRAGRRGLGMVIETIEKEIWRLRQKFWRDAMPNEQTETLLCLMEMLLGREGMQKLAQAHVAVFGIGGVGSLCRRGPDSPAASALSR